jgi:hypothetical protein
MTDARDQFAELARRGHEVFTAAVQAWEQAARSLAETARRPGGRLPDIRESVDAAFDFAAQMLADQRDFTKTVMAVGSQVIAATAQRAAPSGEPSGESAAEPEAVTGSELRSAPEPVSPTVESQPRAVASEGPSDTAETVTQPDTVGTDTTVAPERQPDTGERATAEEEQPVAQPDTGERGAAAPVRQPDTAEPVEQPSTAEPDAAAAAKEPAPAPGRDDSAGTATPETRGPAPAAVARKAAAKRTTAAKKTATAAAKKTATPAAKKAAAAAKKTAAPAKRTGPAKRTAGPRDGESS